MLLAGLTGAMPGGEVSGAHALKSPTRIKQLLLAGTYEGIEENMQQSIEQGAVKFAGDKNFFDLFTNA